MEQQSESGPESAERAGVARGQSVLHVLPHDDGGAATFLLPLLERIEPAVTGTQTLMLAADVETALSLARAAANLPHGGILAVTGAKRAQRMLRLAPPPAIAGTPSTLLQLVRASALKLDGVRTLAIAWADALLAAGENDALEAMMAELPKDAARVIVTTRITPEVEALAERYARRAVRVGEASAESPSPMALRYVITAPAARRDVLRRLLDDLDPERAVVFARTEGAVHDVQALGRTLGYAAASDAFQVARAGDGPVSGAPLLVLYELPESPRALRALASGGGAPTPVAMVAPRQLDALRALADGGPLEPLVLSGPAAQARSAIERLRDELRAVLVAGVPAAPLLALEPLLAEYDGAELAAGALWLLERAREGASRQATSSGERPTERPRSAPLVRVFVNAGSRDGITARDLVGAIANQAGISSVQIGKIELRESHAVVEIAPDAAPTVVDRLTGATIRGRRVVARLDQERPSASRGAARGEGSPRGKDAPRRGAPSGGPRPPRSHAPRRGE